VAFHNVSGLKRCPLGEENYSGAEKGKSQSDWGEAGTKQLIQENKHNNGVERKTALRETAGPAKY